MDHAAQLAQFSAILEQKGFLTGLEGNTSIFDRETGKLYITPSGRMKLLLTKEDICVVDASGRQIAGRGKPSSEHLLHEAVYRAREDVGAVIHSHCPYLTAYALRFEDFIAPENSSLAEIFPRIRCLPFARHGTAEVCRGIEEALASCDVFLLGGHGAVCAAKDIESCTGLLCAAEGFAKTVWLASHP